jgi:hypothetical protein
VPIERLTNVADFDDLLGEIRTFLSATGDWTIHRDLLTPDEGVASGGRILVVSNGDVLAGLRSTTTGVGAGRLYLFDGIPPYSGTPNLDALPGNSGIVMTDGTYNSATTPDARVFTTTFTGPFPTAFLFTDDPSTYCHVVIEVTAGKYRHILFGNLHKFGSWTGGGYYASHRWTTDNTTVDAPDGATHTVPFDGSSDAAQGGQWTVHYEGGGFVWVSPLQDLFNGVSRRRARGSVRGGFGTLFRSIEESAFSGLVALNPVTVWPVTTTDTPVTTRCAGRVPDVAEINLKNFSPGDSYFIGADEWIVFPVATKGLPTVQLNVENSGYYGLAYLVRP